MVRRHQNLFNTTKKQEKNIMEQRNNTTRIVQVQYGYDYVNEEMIGNDAFTEGMITDTLRMIDMAYWRLLKTERRTITGR